MDLTTLGIFIGSSDRHGRRDPDRPGIRTPKTASKARSSDDGPARKDQMPEFLKNGRVK
jgi:hypothetical protein